MKIFVSLMVGLFLLASLSLSLDESAMLLQEEALERSFIAFGLAKGLNAIISLLQGTQLYLTPVGIGINISIGEVLDPFNDLVERFSWVMLLATVSLGVQKLLLVLSTKLFLAILLFTSGIVLVSSMWIEKIQNQKVLFYAGKVFMFLLLLRFGAIVFVYSSQMLYSSVLQDDYENATVVIGKTQQELENLEEKRTTLLQEQKSSGFFESISAKYESVVEKLNISQELENMQASIEISSKKIVSLITIFIVQSLIFPFLYLLIMYASFKYIFNIGFNSEKIKLLYNGQKLSKERV
ncbi:MAG: hypothetical protein JXQ67_03095 [Campylobacterales bacterium]|nr:hypothetical protein [Campylobacterales bacterium]